MPLRLKTSHLTIKSYFYKSLMTNEGRFLNTLFSASTIMEAVRGYHLSPLLGCKFDIFNVAQRERQCVYTMAGLSLYCQTIHQSLKCNHGC